MQKKIGNGILGGLAGGVVFGMLMGMMGMLTTIAGMMGSSSVVVGFFIHMMISAMLGAGFGVVLGSGVAGYASGIRRGLGYGAIWWILGPLTLMPFLMGMGIGVNWNVQAAASALLSLMGHLLYGVILGSVYARLGERAYQGSVAGV